LTSLLRDNRRVYPPISNLHIGDQRRDEIIRGTKSRERGRYSCHSYRRLPQDTTDRAITDRATADRATAVRATADGAAAGNHRNITATTELYWLISLLFRITYMPTKTRALPAFLMSFKA
jgi:hypothetical protein